MLFVMDLSIISLDCDKHVLQHTLSVNTYML
jgi:hypothetical protein